MYAFRSFRRARAPSHPPFLFATHLVDTRAEGSLRQELLASGLQRPRVPLQSARPMPRDPAIAHQHAGLLQHGGVHGLAQRKFNQCLSCARQPATSSDPPSPSAAEFARRGFLRLLIFDGRNTFGKHRCGRIRQRSAENPCGSAQGCAPARCPFPVIDRPAYARHDCRASLKRCSSRVPTGIRAMRDSRPCAAPMILRISTTLGQADDPQIACGLGCAADLRRREGGPHQRTGRLSTTPSCLTAALRSRSWQSYGRRQRITVLRPPTP